MGGTNKKHMVTYNVDLSGKSPVSATHSHADSRSPCLLSHMSCGTVLLQA